MSLKDIEVKKEYRVPRDNVSKELYVKALKQSILYKRSAGFFKSSSLCEIAQGLYYLIENNGKMKLIISPHLDQQDYEAINKGYELREKIIEQQVLNLIKNPKTNLEEEKLNLLATLIAEEKLDIKIAFSLKGEYLGLYHEKVGLFYDEQGNIIAFSGSMNETENALTLNYETIDVFNSWESEDSKERTLNKEIAFNELWNNLDLSAKVIEFPEAAKRKLLNYKKDNINIELLKTEKIENEFYEEINKKILELNRPNIPTMAKIDWRDYQDEATEEWKKNGYRGIFDMATGTGKTLTGLKGITELSNELNNNLTVIIVCPYQHLVEQWVDDIVKFNIKPIIAYSKRNWKKLLDDAIRDQKLKIKGREFVCVITTNATYASKYFQEQLLKIRGKKLLVVDEAHNFGSRNLLKTLDEKFDYRLALSATIERHHDEYGTNKLIQYFGKRCITYDLEKAIKQGKLTKYKYYPIIVTLTYEELENYIQKTKEIGKNIREYNGKKELTDTGKMIAMARARIVAGAQQKMYKLKEQIIPYKDKKHILVYCGTADSDDSALNENLIVHDEELRQIDVVTKMLGLELGMQVSQFTSKEDIEERKILKQKFSEGESLKVLIAIKCLDEGVNIPEIKTAFILASTTNPKEYIQRRGRVLRLADDKPYAEIYDFITLPRPIDEVPYITEEQMKLEMSLVRNELIRAQEFTRLSDNEGYGQKMIDQIKETYQIYDDLDIDSFILDEEEYYGN